MNGWVVDKIYPSRDLDLEYKFIPLNGYRDRGYAVVVLRHQHSQLAEVMLHANNYVSKTQLDSEVFVMMEALAQNKWLITGKHLFFEHFETQTVPGVIGEFREEAPRNYGSW